MRPFLEIASLYPTVKHIQMIGSFLLHVAIKQRTWSVAFLLSLVSYKEEPKVSAYMTLKSFDKVAKFKDGSSRQTGRKLHKNSP